MRDTSELFFDSAKQALAGTDFVPLVYWPVADSYSIDRNALPKEGVSFDLNRTWKTIRSLQNLVAAETTGKGMTAVHREAALLLAGRLLQSQTPSAPPLYFPPFEFSLAYQAASTFKGARKEMAADLTAIGELHQAFIKDCGNASFRSDGWEKIGPGIWEGRYDKILDKLSANASWNIIISQMYDPNMHETTFATERGTAMTGRILQACDIDAAQIVQGEADNFAGRPSRDDNLYVSLSYLQKHGRASALNAV